MRKPLLAIMALALTISACGRIAESRLNPFNWFGRSERVATTATQTGISADGRQLVDQVITLSLDRTPGGGILRATGLPPTQGFWDAELVARPVEDGALVYDFRVFPPPGGAAVSTQRSREVVVATFIPDTRLAGLRQITVQGARSALSTRR